MKRYLSTLFSLAALLWSGASVMAQSFVIVGTGTASNGATAYPAPFGNYYWGARHQFFVTAAQLSAAGLPANAQVQSMGFNVTNTNGAAAHQNFQIRVFTTTATNPLSASWFSGTPVAQTTPTTHTPVVGWNQFTFTSPFTWNGTDNLVIETCFNNVSYSWNASTQWTTTLSGATFSRWYRADATGVCTSTLTTGTSTTTRPNIRIGYTVATPCSGTPAPGATTTTLTSACPSQSFTLGLSTPPTGTGLTYQWQRSTDGGVTWTNFGTSSATQTTTLTPFVTTQFRCIVTCTNSGQSGTSTPVTVTTGDACQCAAYCVPTTNCSWGDNISNVTLTQGATTLINNTTGCGGTNGFNLFTSPNPSLMQGQNYSLSVTTSASYSQGLRVWFDWNGDGDFVDAGEEITLSPNNYVGTAPATYTATVTVPMSAVPGSTRLRAKCNYAAAPPTDPCANTSWGETEDYCITIIAAPACTGTPNPGNTTASVSSACNGQNITLNYTGSVTGTGLTWNWEYSTDGGAMWTTFSTNAPPVNYTFGTQTTQFRCTVTCTHSGQSGTSTPVTVNAGGTCVCATYCTPTVTWGACTFMWTSNVTTTGGLTNFNNSTGCSAGGYGNFGGSFSCSQYPGSTVNISMTSANWAMNYRVFIDWNGDGDFLDIDEQAVSINNTGGLFTVSGTILVPGWATPGTYRMRVIGDYNLSPMPTACGPIEYGETEDYCFTVSPPPPCSGTPNPGNTTASSSIGCNGQNITLAFSGTVTGTGLTYNWEYSTDGGAMWTTFSTSAPPVNYTFGTQTTQFRCTVTCTNSGQSGTSTPVTVTAGNNCQCGPYCSPTTSCTYPDIISNVTLTQGSTTLINNSTGCNNTSTGFTLFTAPNPSLMQGQSYNFSITTSGDVEGIRLWIDWNGDGDYVDVGEELFNGYLGTNPATYTGSFVVPMSAVPGSTRLRAKCNYLAAPPTDPCANTTFGETEDYCITIIAAPACTGTPNPGNTTASVSSACNGQNITLNYTGSVTGTGLTWNWEYSTNGGATWTSFSTNAPPVTYTFGTVTTQFRCTVTCSNSGQSGTSTPVTVTAASACQCASYCTTNLHLFASECITNVSINTLNNTTSGTCALPGYSLQSATTTLMRGATYTFSMTNVGTAIASVWFDWNGDATFQPSEHFQPYTSGSGGSINVTVPLSASLGEIRMRVRTRLAGNPNGPTDACTSFGSGETEDYCITIQDPPACSGTPNPGNTTASTTSACSGSPVTLNLTGSLAFTGLTYNWQYSTDGGAMWTTFSTSPPPVTYTFGTGITMFRCQVTCTNSSQSAFSTPVTVNPGGNCQCLSYGASAATSSFDGEILNVTIGSVSNSSNCTTPAPGPGSQLGMYSNFTTSVAAHTGVLGSSVNFSITVGTCNGNYGHYLKIFVDWNQDGDFVDTGEEVYVSGSVTPTTTVTGSFTVPVSASLGTTRLRVVLNETWDPNNVTPTGTYTWGETEDYCFNVSPPTCTWTGNVPAGPVWGHWTVAGNWDCGYVPTLTTNVIIPNVPIQPAIVMADGNAYNVTMHDGTKLLINNSNRRLNVANNFSAGTGTGAAINHSTGQVRMLASDGTGEMSGNANIHTLDIAAPGAGNVTITSGSIVVRNAVRLVSGTLNTMGNLTLEALNAPAHSAAIVDNFSAGFTGTMVGNVKAQRRVPRFGNMYLGSPVNNGTIADMAAHIPGGLNHNGIGTDGSYYIADPTCSYASPASPLARIMQYDETAPTTCQFNGWQIRLTGTTQNGRGYLVMQPSATSNPFYQFTGIANTGNITTPITRTASNATATQGMNLLSNPYPSGIDLDAFYAANSGQIGAVANLYNGTTFVPVQMNDGTPSPIASFQGFIVNKLTVGSGTVTFNQSMRVTGNTLAFTDAMNVPHKLEVEVVGSDAEHRDVTYVYFGEGVSDGFDLREDGYKYYSVEGYPTLYTLAEGTAWPVSVNGLNVQTRVSEVPVGLHPGAAGRFVFTLRGGDRLPAGLVCYLVDRKEQKEVRVGSETSYVFDINGAETRDRFVLKFRREVAVTEQAMVASEVPQVKETVAGTEADRAWVSGGRVYLSLGRDVPGRLTLRLVDMSGKVVWTDAIQNAVRGVYDLGELDVAAGLYILNWSDGSGTQSARLPLGLAK